MRYLFRSIDKYAAFITGVKLLVQSESQVPAWVNRDTVDVVLHSDFIPNRFLPTFNSCTIEMFLHMIPGLAEHFIYGNDDMYFLNTAKREDFFKNNRPVCCISHEVLPPNPKSYHLIFKNSSDVARIGTTAYDSSSYFKPAHVQCAMSKTFNRLTYEELEPMLLKTITRFRDRKNVCQYVYPVSSVLRGAAILDNAVTRFCGDIDFTKGRIRSLFESPNPPICTCFNSGVGEGNEKFLQKFFDKVFPDKCKFEA